MAANMVDMDCKVEISAVFGRKREVDLTRTRYSIEVVKRPVCDMGSCHWVLGGVGDTEMGVTLDWNGECFECRATAQHPFKINQVWCFHALLRLGDELDLGRNILHFKKQSGRKDQAFNEEIQEYCRSLPSSPQVPILIEGETGVGKGHLARSLHEHWHQNTSAPFIHLNLAGLPEGLLESELFGHQKGAFTGAIHGYSGAFIRAHGGTLFLDEIDSLPVQVQLKLLLFLDHRRVRPLGSMHEMEISLKLIVATGQSLELLVETGDIRPDFYYRVSSGARVKLPSLRDCPEKITSFIDEFVARNDIYIDPELASRYRLLPWPGNFRQLKGHLDLKLCCAKYGKLDFDHWDEMLFRQADGLMQDKSQAPIKTLKEVKAQHAWNVYQQLDGKVELSAKALGISSSTLKSLLTRP